MSVRTRLIQRASALQEARSFFEERGLIEVDCLALGTSAAIDVNIDLFVTLSPIHGKRFLFSSPEYPMKRLLSRGSGDIYYLGHVWRHEEAGRSHSPEFLIAEWYRLGFSFQQMINETIAFAELFVGTRPHHALTYRQAFRTYAHIDPYTASLNELKQACQRFQGYPVEDSSRDDLLNLLLALTVEPHFDTDAITILFHYPASQAALARQIEDDGYAVAERFEVYCGGLELANGYHELADAKEQRARFVADNEQRQQAGKEPYPIDEALIEALARGLPDCCGVAVGMDRLLMLQHKAPTIADVMPLPW